MNLNSSWTLPKEGDGSPGGLVPGEDDITAQPQAATQTGSAVDQPAVLNGDGSHFVHNTSPAAAPAGFPAAGSAVPPIELDAARGGLWEPT